MLEMLECPRASKKSASADSLESNKRRNDVRDQRRPCGAVERASDCCCRHRHWWARGPSCALSTWSQPEAAEKTDLVDSLERARDPPVAGGERRPQRVERPPSLIVATAGGGGACARARERGPRWDRRSLEGRRVESLCVASKQEQGLQGGSRSTASGASKVGRGRRQEGRLRGPPRVRSEAGGASTGRQLDAPSRRPFYDRPAGADLVAQTVDADPDTSRKDDQANGGSVEPSCTAGRPRPGESRRRHSQRCSISLQRGFVSGQRPTTSRRRWDDRLPPVDQQQGRIDDPAKPLCPSMHRQVVSPSLGLCRVVASERLSPCSRLLLPPLSHSTSSDCRLSLERPDWLRRSPLVTLLTSLSVRLDVPLAHIELEDAC